VVITPYHRNRKDLDKMAVNYIRDIEKQKLWALWNNMYTRCYSDKYHERSPQYTDCSICDEWLDDKQSFYDWVEENFYTVGDEQIDLDKDILVKGNKIYSPDTCIFAPHSINTYFENLTREPVYLQKLNKYRMDIWIEDRNVRLGYFDSEEEAKKMYIRHKEAAILAKADLLQDRIPRALYNAMINWKIELSDWDK
jgi:hypothetical protein